MKAISREFTGTNYKYQLVDVEFDNDCNRYVLTKTETGAYNEPVTISEEEATKLVDITANKDAEFGLGLVWFIKEEEITATTTKEAAYTLSAWLLSENNFEVAETIIKTNFDDCFFDLQQILPKKKNFTKLLRCLSFNYDLVIVSAYELLHKRPKNKKTPFEKTGWGEMCRQEALEDVMAF